MLNFPKAHSLSRALLKWLKSGCQGRFRLGTVIGKGLDVECMGVGSSARAGAWISKTQSFRVPKL